MNLPYNLTDADAQFMERIQKAFVAHVKRRGHTYRVAMILLSVLVTTIVLVLPVSRPRPKGAKRG